MRPFGRKDEQEKCGEAALVAAFDWAHILTLALVVVSLFVAFALRVVGVQGDSMVPTLQDGDRLLLSYVSGDYVRGDIVVVDRYTDEPLIKRVVALAGDTVSITEDNRLCINGMVCEEPYITGQTVKRDMIGEIIVPEGHVFVLGDNRTWSKDSRLKEIGPVSTKDIVGKVVFRLWPPKKMGGIG